MLISPGEEAAGKAQRGCFPFATPRLDHVPLLETSQICFPHPNIGGIKEISSFGHCGQLRHLIIQLITHAGTVCSEDTAPPATLLPLQWDIELAEQVL